MVEIPSFIRKPRDTPLAWATEDINKVLNDILDLLWKNKKVIIILIITNQLNKSYTPSDNMKSLIKYVQNTSNLESFVKWVEDIDKFIRFIDRLYEHQIPIFAKLIDGMIEIAKFTELFNKLIRKDSLVKIFNEKEWVDLVVSLIDWIDDMEKLARIVSHSDYLYYLIYEIDIPITIREINERTSNDFVKNDKYILDIHRTSPYPERKTKIKRKK